LTVQRPTLVLSLTLLLATGTATAQTAQPGPPQLAQSLELRARKEWIGLEITPAWLQLSAEQRFRPKSPAPLAVGIGGTLRLLRQAYKNVYWTPLQVGLGVGTPQLSIFLHASTEVGALLPVFNRRLELGGAMGMGAVIVTYNTGCDGDCITGGNPLVFSPVVRFIMNDSRRLAAALFTRAVIPPAGANNGFAMMILFGVDLGIARL
jgi:hypothetical protein